MTALLALMVASFTTRMTDFAGEVNLELVYGNETLALRPVFEPRETNLFDRIGEGPTPRYAVVSFKTPKPHTIRFVYDRKGRVWQGEVSFPDPELIGVVIENSTLDFVNDPPGDSPGVSADGRGVHVFRGSIKAKAILAR